MGKAGICRGQLTARGNKIIMDLLLVLLLPRALESDAGCCCCQRIPRGSSAAQAGHALRAPHLHPDLRSHQPGSRQLSGQFHSSLHPFLPLAQGTAPSFA